MVLVTLLQAMHQNNCFEKTQQSTTQTEQKLLASTVVAFVHWTAKFQASELLSARSVCTYIFHLS